MSPLRLEFATPGPHPPPEWRRSRGLNFQFPLQKSQIFTKKNSITKITIGSPYTYQGWTMDHVVTFTAPGPLCWNILHILSPDAPRAGLFCTWGSREIIFLKRVREERGIFNHLGVANSIYVVAASLKHNKKSAY